MERRPPGGGWARRDLLKALAVAGVGTTAFGRALAVLAEGGPAVTDEMIRQAQWISGLDLTDDERELMLRGVNDTLADFERLRGVEIGNEVPPAFVFDPVPGTPTRSSPPLRRARPSGPTLREAATTEDVAFSSLAGLAGLVQTRRMSSVELTRLYLDRLERYDPVLHCVISLTKESALEQAAAADREIAAGRSRGPLHGIPWGVKDLLAAPGYRTTWGATPYRDQVRDETATVVSRLRQAGAVLVAKLSVGALAWGDVWFDETTRNPWNPEDGSSGSSAGSASATAAGLVGFSIGSETWGSIVSPCTRCGATGFRPTFGRVSRHGAMALSWTMDKIGPIARSVDDCALVFDAIHGADGLDPTAIDRPFRWPSGRDPRTLRVGYVPALFEEDRTGEDDDEDDRQALQEWQALDLATLEVLKELGFDLVPIELPGQYPVSALSFILTAEAAAAFDDLTRDGRDDLLVRQVEMAWPNVFRQGQLIPAVEYIRANRVRTLVMREMERVMSEVDVYVSPSYVGDNLLLTNLTGHPAVVVPNGFRSHDGTPVSITFTGGLYRDEDLLAVAHAYQQATDFHLRRPPLDRA